MGITIKELKTKLSASLNMLKGFCANGKLCNGWHEINENVIEFRFAEDGRFARIKVDEIEAIDICKIYDKRNGFNKSYPNVIAPEH